MNPKFSVVGIDMALRFTGCYAVNEHGDWVGNCLIVPDDMKGYERTLFIVQEICNFINRVNISSCPVVSVVMEDYVIGKGRSSGSNIFRVQGAVMGRLSRYKVPCYLIHPSRLRHFQIGDPCPTTPITVESLSEHEVDAWGLSMMGLAIIQPSINATMTKSMQAIISKLERSM